MSFRGKYQRSIHKNQIKSYKKKHKHRFNKSKIEELVPSTMLSCPTSCLEKPTLLL